MLGQRGRYRFRAGDGTLCGCEELIMVVLWDVMVS